MKKQQNIIRIFVAILTCLTLVMTLVACRRDKKDAEIRVMSYNILHPKWCTDVSNLSVKGRVGLVYDIIDDYLPDVIGIQEAESSWHKELNRVLKDDGIYKFACKTNSEGKCNMTAILYNANTLKLVEEFVLEFEPGTEIRVLSVAVFEKLSDGKRFVVTNTHPTTAAAMLYKIHMDLLTENTNKVIEKYKDFPLIMTGDFNTKEQSEYYTNFMKNTGVKDAKYEAEKLVREYNTAMGYNVKPEKGNTACIDHIFVNDMVTVKKFDAVVDHKVEKVSDHIPIYADITLNK